MDTITHALSVWMVFLAAGVPDLILFGMLGATLLDIDILFTPISDRYPERYIFTHGGFVHSLFGAAFVAIGAFIGLACVAGAGGVWGYVLPEITTAAFASIIAGALLHLALDTLAYPGIPLLYPISDKKYTIGIFPGPSIVLLVASSAFLVLTAFRIGTLADMRPYAGVFLLYLAISAALRAYVAMGTDGTPVPTRDPLRWILIRETADTYRVEFFTISRGITGTRVFQSMQGPRPERPNHISGGLRSGVTGITPTSPRQRRTATPSPSTTHCGSWDTSGIHRITPTSPSPGGSRRSSTNDEPWLTHLTLGRMKQSPQAYGMPVRI